MGLMSYIHSRLLRRGLLSDILPDEDAFDVDDAHERKSVRDEIEVRAAEEREMRREVSAAVRRLRELDRHNHYGESIRKAFGGR